MPAEVAVDWQVEGSGLEDAPFQRVVEAALAAVGSVRTWAVDLLLCDDETIRDYNRQYRATDTATDVLSFSLLEGEPFPTIEGEPEQLGQLVVSLPTAIRQAGEHGRTALYEVGHLMIHGTLHLLGHDHAEPDEEREMRRLEDLALAAVFGAADGMGWEGAGLES